MIMIISIIGKPKKTADIGTYTREYLKKRELKERASGLRKGRVGKFVSRKVWLFGKYVKSHNKALVFVNDKYYPFLRKLPLQRRLWLFHHLKEVDPENFPMLRAWWYKKRTASRRKIKQEHEHMSPKAVKEAVEKELVAISVNRPEDCKNVAGFNYVQADTVLEMIATLMATGYTRDEIKKKTSFDDALIDRVPNHLVAKMRRNIPESIVNALDQKIYKDLMETGSVTDDMERADRIVSRRRKLYLDNARLVKDTMPQGSGTKVIDASEIEKKQQDRFGSKK